MSESEGLTTEGRVSQWLSSIDSTLRGWALASDRHNVAISEARSRYGEEVDQILRDRRESVRNGS